MSRETHSTKLNSETQLASRICAKEARKLKARRKSVQGVWIGLGAMGVIGWSVAVPTLLGAASGIWLDRHAPRPYSWTLTLLMAGLFVGCGIAWHWVANENAAIRKEQEDNHDPE